MPTVTVTWHSMPDACGVCKDLNGYQWVFDIGRGDILSDALFHPVHGIVWSLTDGSNAHSRGYAMGSHVNHCRCFISVKFDLEDVLARCVYLREVLAASLNELDDADVGVVTV